MDDDEVLQIRNFIARIARDQGIPILEELDPEIELLIQGEG